MQTITLGEHYVSPASVDGPVRDLTRSTRPARANEMEAGGIDVQVLSLTSPGVEQLDPGEAVAVARAEIRFADLWATIDRIEQRVLDG